MLIPKSTISHYMTVEEQDPTAGPTYIVVNHKWEHEAFAHLIRFVDTESAYGLQDSEYPIGFVESWKKLGFQFFKCLT